jgi:cell wall-associated NlpC family hydrolase
MLNRQIGILLAILLAGCGGSEGLQYGDQSFRGDPATHTAVSFARKQIGTPYRFGGKSPSHGFDCSGLVYYSYRKAGLAVPRTTDGLYESTFPVDPRALRQGDLLFFSIKGKVSHVGIYVGKGKFVHAPSSGKSVSYASIENPYWREHLVRAGRLF